MKYVGCVHLYIPWKFGERGSTPRGATGPSFSFFVCLSVTLRCMHRKPRRCIYALNLGGTGISSPDSFSYRSNFRFRSSFCSRSSSSSTTSGDIFYCSGSRQLNHSSWNVWIIREKDCAKSDTLLLKFQDSTACSPEKWTLKFKLLYLLNHICYFIKICRACGRYPHL